MVGMLYNHDPTEIQTTGSIRSFLVTLVEFMLRAFYSQGSGGDLTQEKRFYDLEISVGSRRFNGFYECA